MIRLEQRIYGNPCEGGEDDDPLQTPPFMEADLDGNGSGVKEPELFLPCLLGDDSSPVGTGDPPQ